MSYSKILVALDGSPRSDYAAQAALDIAATSSGCELLACHAYAAKLHFNRFEAMEKGLPDKYQAEEQLETLRKTHDDLIENGLELISDSYTREICLRAESRGVRYRSLLPEGKNYTRLLDAARGEKAGLVVLGSSGMGETPDGLLGSVAERMLLYLKGADVLLVKNSRSLRNRPVVVGIDGSEASYHAFQKALSIAESLGIELIAVAVYDPFFHATVFKKIADVLPPKDQEKFNFTAQEKLHDEIIDDGLEKVYRDGLKKAELLALAHGTQIKTEMLEGKVYDQICHYAALKNAGLVVIGRHGLHREEPALLGSNSNQICRIAAANVLVAVPGEEKLELPQLRSDSEPLPWSAEAEKALGHVPEFIRARAKQMIAEYARTHGHREVTAELVAQVRNRLGMGRPAKTDGTAQPNAGSTDETAADAIRVILRTSRNSTPDFHRKIAAHKIRGQVLRTGDRFINCIVVSTEPESPVRITAETVIEFVK